VVQIRNGLAPSFQKRGLCKVLPDRHPLWSTVFWHFGKSSLSLRFGGKLFHMTLMINSPIVGVRRDGALAKPISPKERFQIVEVQAAGERKIFVRGLSPEMANEMLQWFSMEQPDHKYCVEPDTSGR
jgi:hypothetical protein